MEDERQLWNTVEDWELAEDKRACFENDEELMRKRGERLNSRSRTPQGFTLYGL